jgi:ribosomal protein S18 acetylase RimI-like enzyme
VNDKIVGFLSYSNKEDKTFMEINALYILEEYHFNGLGKAMVSVVEKMFTNNEKIKLWVSVKNKNAINFYERVGFKFNGVTDSFKIGNERIEVIQLSKKVEA